MHKAFWKFLMNSFRDWSSQNFNFCLVYTLLTAATISTNVTMRMHVKLVLNVLTLLLHTIASTLTNASDLHVHLVFSVLTPLVRLLVLILMSAPATTLVMMVTTVTTILVHSIALTSMNVRQLVANIPIYTIVTTYLVVFNVFWKIFAKKTLAITDFTAPKKISK